MKQRIYFNEVVTRDEFHIGGVLFNLPRSQQNKQSIDKKSH